MTSWLCLNLPYQKDSTAFFYGLLEFNYPIWLDSCAHANLGRYDILSANPYKTLVQNDLGEVVSSYDGNESSESDFLEALEELLPNESGNVGDFAFSGALGYFSYEFGVHRAGLSAHNPSQHVMPSAWFGIYSWAVIVDHKHQTATLIYQDESSLSLFINQIKQRWLDSLNHLEQVSKSGFRLLNSFESNITFLDYKKALGAIHKYINQGDSYQVNYSHCFSADFEGDAFYAYALLRKKNPSEYAVFLRLPEGDILSFSPELLVQASDNKLVTKPIKGTAARTYNHHDDEKIQKDLLNCPKNRAENMMIVDLLRNDLSKVSTLSSVKVDAFLKVETMPSVFHLVSTVSSLLSAEHNYYDVLCALFPGGSITGAPKYKTMQVIDELEKLSRSIYCGSIGHFSPDHNMCFNIAIRTMIAAEGSLFCNAGGGIVLDSNCDEEYQETIDKICVLTKTLQNYSNVISSVNSKVGVV